MVERTLTEAQSNALAVLADGTYKSAEEVCQALNVTSLVGRESVRRNLDMLAFLKLLDREKRPVAKTQEVYYRVASNGRG